ncbi:Rossmann-fold NAD(P)-binding domain-containing protein [Jatrophihabitans fulvus]
MRTALIGHTGFVGSNLAAAHPFTDVYNTANIADLRGQRYDLVVSAAARADSHRINNDGAADLAEIDEYLSVLTSVDTDRLVLISTVCVYPGGTTPDESTPLSPDGLTPYGANRLHMERVLAERFATLPVRLPQLYGRNLKKGIVHDLLNDYRVEFIRPDGLFQYYDLRRLWDDIGVALDHGLDALNIATPPLRSDRVASEVFGVDIAGQQVPGEESPFSRMYTRDMRTAHAHLYGGPDGYLHDEATELAALRSFVAERRG